MQRPNERADYIERALTESANLNTDPTCHAFGLQLQPRMMDVCPILDLPSTNCENTCLCGN